MRRALIATKRSGDGSPKAPYSTPLTGVSWQDATGQPVEDIVIGAYPFTVEAWLDDAQLAAIKADARFAVLWDVDADDEEAVGAVDTTTLSNLYAADIADYISEQDDRVAALIECQRRPPWHAGVQVYDGSDGKHEQTIMAYGNNLWRCFQSHITQSDWTPSAVPALWGKFYEAEAGPQPWVQPAGAHDAYHLGDRVTYDGWVWECTATDGAGNNVWAPDVYGWTKVKKL